MKAVFRTGQFPFEENYREGQQEEVSIPKSFTSGCRPESTSGCPDSGNKSLTAGCKRMGHCPVEFPFTAAAEIELELKDGQHFLEFR